MAMAFVGGALFGAVVSELLKEVLNVLKAIKDKDKNLLELETQLQRLEPCVEELRSVIRRHAAHPARVWLTGLEQELKKARDLVKEMKGKGLVLRVRMSKRLEPVNVRICKLIYDAVVANWASTLSTLEDLTQSVDNMRAWHEHNCQKQEEHWSWLKQRWEKQEQVRKEEDTRRQQMLQPFDVFDSSKVDFGGDLVAEPLIASLTAEQEYTKWVGLWAIGGAGKTFTARKIVNDPRVKQHFSGGQFWITVSKDRLPALVLLQNLYNQLQGGTALPNTEAAQETIKNLLNRDKALLVVDDVWDAKMLMDLDVISEEKKGVILITTRDDKILREVCANIIPIHPLRQDDSWQLFSWHAFHDHGRSLPPSLEPIAKDVAAECHGLPLALEVIGASMRSKYVYNKEKNQGRSLVDEWKNALERLKGADVYSNEYKKLFGRLQLSVETLPEADVRLQDCFFDFAAFPEDWDIAIEDLVDMWVAEGLVKADADSKLSSEDQARDLLRLLVAKSMIMEVTLDDDDDFNIVDVFDDDDRRTRYKVHDVMRDLARQNLKINFTTKQKMDVQEMKCLYASGLNLRDFPKLWSVRRTRFAVEKLSLFCNNIQQLPEYFDAPNLRVLILERNRHLPALPSGFFRTFTSLRVLNLAQTGIEIIPDEVVDSLKSLVLLDLRGCWELRIISRRIQNLNHLETMFLEGSRLVDREVLSLPTSLRTLSGYFGDEVCQWRSIENLKVESETCPSGISLLAGLEELNLYSKAGGFPAELMRLHHLRILKVTTDGWGRFEIPCLGELPKLEVLCLTTIGSEEVHFPPSFAGREAFPCLKEMNLDMTICTWWTFHPGTMPMVESLSVSNWGKVSDSLETCKSLRELNTLMSLQISDLDENLIFCEPDRFANLESLRITMHEKAWRKLPTSIGALPRLRYMELRAELSDGCLRRSECEGYDCLELLCPHIIPSRLLELEKEGKLEITRKIIE